MKPHNYDRIELGNRIRRLRKERGFTMKMLAEGICSTGKMSNIENGITDITKNELEQVAQKLSISIEELKPKISVNEKMITSSLGQVENYILLQMFDAAEKLLDNIKKTHYDFFESGHKIRYFYLKGVLISYSHNFKQADFYFYRLLEFPISHDQDIQYRSKAYQKLGLIAYKKRELSKAFEYMERSLEELKKSNHPVTWINYYNMSIISLTQGNSLQSRALLTMIRKSEIFSNVKLIYLSALIQFFEGHYTQGKKTIEELRPKLLETMDTDIMIRSTISVLYFSKFSLDEDEHFLLNTYSQLDDLLYDIPDESNQELFLKLLQFLTLHLTKKQNIEKAEKFLEIAYTYKEKYPNLKSNYVTPLVHAYLYKLNKDYEKQKSLLYTAKEMMEKNRIKNINYFVILYEIHLLENTIDPNYNNIIQELLNHNNLSTIDIIQKENIIPPLYQEGI